MSRADDDDYDDRPRRRRPRDDDDDDYDDRPRRAKGSGGGGAAAAAGGASVLLIVLGVVFGLLIVCGGIGAALLLPAVAKVREAAARAKDSNNFRQVAIGMQNHHDTNRQFPAADKSLSWLVVILPYIEQQGLYAQFDQKQAWDGPRNRPLADTRVLPYSSPLDDTADTRIRVFTGPDTLFPPGERPLSIAEMTDGLSNTILAVESSELVPWPQPRELPYVKGGPLPAFGHPNRPTGFLVVMADGSVKFVKRDVSEGAIRSGITPRGNDGIPDF